MNKNLLLFFTGAASLAIVATAQAGIDVVIGIDESGSMRPAIDRVKTNVGTIYDALPAGSKVGLVGYGTKNHCGGNNQIPHIHTPVTTDRNVFYNSVDDMIASGGIEQGYRLVYEIATDTVGAGWNSSTNTCSANPLLGFTGTQHCQIVITDERMNQNGRTQQEAIAALQDNGGIFFGILRSQYTSEGQALAAATGGQVFDFDSFIANPTPVIDAVLAACVASASLEVENNDEDMVTETLPDGTEQECLPGGETEITFDVTSKNLGQQTLTGVELTHSNGPGTPSPGSWPLGSILAGNQKTEFVTLFLAPDNASDYSPSFVEEFTATSTTSGISPVIKSKKINVCQNSAPIAKCKDVTLDLGCDDQIVLTSAQVDDGSSDPDGDPITFSLSRTNFGTSDIGVLNAVTLTVTDDQGAPGTCVATVTVTKDESPEALADCDCPCDGSWRRQADYVRCVTRAARTYFPSNAIDVRQAKKSYLNSRVDNNCGQ